MTTEVPEIHFAIVRPLGVDGGALRQHLSAALHSYGFTAHPIRFSAFIDELLPNLAGRENSFAYYKSHMDGGDLLRSESEHGARVLALFATAAVAAARSAYTTPVAFLHDSVLHPEEMEALRQAYGNALFVIAIHTDASTRRHNLRRELKSTADPGTSDQDIEDQIDELMLRHQGKKGAHRRSLSFQDTFHKADLFLAGEANSWKIEAGDPSSTYPHESSNEELRRFLRQVFSYPYGAPTTEETSMAHAYMESLRSGSLARRVGAAIIGRDGQVLALGRNDVPKGGGDLYQELDDNNQDDANYLFKKKSFPILKEDVIGADSNDLVKLEMLKDLFESAADDDLIQFEDKGRFAEDALASPAIRTSQFFELIAYGRTVHAEMDAITSAARNGRSLTGSTLYTTTFPCHECARHIIASGVTEVVYVEPYPKSRVNQLHADAVQLADDKSEADADKRVLIRPFVGISHRRFGELFSHIERKHSGSDGPELFGRKVAWGVGETGVRTTIAGESAVVREMTSASRDAAEKLATDAVSAFRSSRRENDH